MRTALSIDPDVLRAAKQRATTHTKSLGAVISELARKGLKGPAVSVAERNGFPVFQVSPDASIVTLEDIKRAEEEDDGRYAGEFARR